MGKINFLLQKPFLFNDVVSDFWVIIQPLAC